MHSSNMLAQSLQRLSSGSKITSPSDDSAGLAVSMKLNAQISRINAASNNVGNAISFSQTQDGYISKVNDALSRMSELSVLSQDVTKQDSDRALYQQEFAALGSYINNVATKDFNGVSLFGGTTPNVTTDSDANTFAMTGVSLANSSYANAIGSTIDTKLNAVNARANVKQAINQLASDRANIGSNMESLTTPRRPVLRLTRRPTR